MEAVASTSRPRTWDVALVALVAAYVVAVVVAVPRSSIPPLTTYASASSTARIADLCAGFGLIGAGILAWIELRARNLGLLAILAGVAWFGPDWDGWDRGPGLARSLGAVAAPFVLALVFHLVAAFPGGRVRSRLVAGAVVAVYGLTAVASVGLALFRDPFLDLNCWRNCVENVFLVLPTSRRHACSERAGTTRRSRSGCCSSRARGGDGASRVERRGVCCCRCSRPPCSSAPPRPRMPSRCCERPSRVRRAPGSRRSSSRARSAWSASRSVSPARSSGPGAHAPRSPGSRSSSARHRRRAGFARRLPAYSGIPRSMSPTGFRARSASSTRRGAPGARPWPARAAR